MSYVFNRDNITIYNKYYDKGSDTYKYARTYLYGVDWQDKQSVTVTDKGLLSADSIRLFIPYDINSEGKSYMKPKDFSRVVEKSKYFTFNNDDKVVKGIIDFEVTGVKPNNISGLEDNYDDVINVISIVDCNLTENWEIGGK